MKLEIINIEELLKIQHGSGEYPPARNDVERLIFEVAADCEAEAVLEVKQDQVEYYTDLLQEAGYYAKGCYDEAYESWCVYFDWMQLPEEYR